MISISKFHDYYLIDESIQIGGSFKSRGVFNCFDSLTDEMRTKQIVTFSSGNHGIAVSALADKFKLSKPIIVVPVWVEEDKKKTLIKMGATVVIGGNTAGECELKANKICSEKNGILLHPFKSDCQIIGYTSLWSEITQVFKGKFDVIVPVGSGGLMASAILFKNECNRDFRIIGIEPKNCASVSTALNLGRVSPISTISKAAPSLNVNYLPDNLFSIFKTRSDYDLAQVNDDDIFSEQKSLWEMGLNVDPAVAACFSYIQSGQYKPRHNKTIIVITGRNKKNTMKTVTRHQIVDIKKKYIDDIFLSKKEEVISEPIFVNTIPIIKNNFHKYFSEKESEVLVENDLFL